MESLHLKCAGFLRIRAKRGYLGPSEGEKIARPRLLVQTHGASFKGAGPGLAPNREAVDGKCIGEQLSADLANKPNSLLLIVGGKVINQQSSCTSLFIDEIASRVRVLCFVPLLLAVCTIPLFWQDLFLKTYHVEPFPLTVWIFAGYHLSKGMPSTVTVLCLLREVVVKIFLLIWLGQLAGVYLHFLPLQDFLLRTVFRLIS